MVLLIHNRELPLRTCEIVPISEKSSIRMQRLIRINSKWLSAFSCGIKLHKKNEKNLRKLKKCEKVGIDEAEMLECVKREINLGCDGLVPLPPPEDNTVHQIWLQKLLENKHFYVNRFRSKL